MQKQPRGVVVVRVSERETATRRTSTRPGPSSRRPRCGARTEATASSTRSEEIDVSGKLPLVSRLFK